MNLQWTTFDDAKAETENKRRHLLLGNGFSVAVHSGFGYGSLFEEAARIDTRIVPLFDGYGFDFESAIARAQLPADREIIREAFIRAVSKIHPKRKYLPVVSRLACGQFLEQFAGTGREAHRGCVFTTNYDLLLYWVLMQRQQALKMYDGFDRDGIWSPFRVWNSYALYLHGALHLFEVPIGNQRAVMEQRKLLWREDATLIDQVRINLALGRFPVFVSEGDSAEKLRRIGRNPYLKKVRRKFRDVCDDPSAALFVVGHSLAEVDAHIVDLIGTGNASVYIGVFSDADERRFDHLANIWSKERATGNRPPLDIHLFRSSECKIWQ